MQKQLTKREKWLTAIAVGGIAVYLLGGWGIIPLVERWQSSNSRLTGAQAQYLGAAKMLRAAAREQQQVTAASGNSAGIAPIAEFLKDIETAAGGKVRIRRFQPLKSAADSRRSAGSTGITNLRVQIDCSGELPELVAFFERVESKNSLTRIRHFYLTPEGKGSRLQCQMILVRLLTA